MADLQRLCNDRIITTSFRPYSRKEHSRIGKKYIQIISIVIYSATLASSVQFNEGIGMKIWV
jgi:hypothetical protein